jgi:hypothetical protein
MAKDAEGEALDGKSLEDLARAEQDAKQAAQGKAADDAASDKDEQDDAQDDDQGDDKAAQDADDKTGDDDPLMLAKWFDEVTGSKEAKNYANDHEWARGTKEALSLVGKRSEDAQLGSKLLEAFGGRKEDLLKLLAGGKPSDGKATDDQDGPIEWNDSWLTQDEQGKPVPTASAPPDALERYARLQARQREWTTDPAAVVRRILQPELKKLEEAQSNTKAQMAEDREQTEVNSLLMEHRALLYVDGDVAGELTPEGAKIDDLVRSGKWHPKTTDLYTRIDTAIELTKGHKPVDRSRKPSRRAMRKPDVAAAAKQKKSNDERFRAGESLASILEEEAKAAAAAAG